MTSPVIRKPSTPQSKTGMEYVSVLLYEYNQPFIVCKNGLPCSPCPHSPLPPPRVHIPGTVKVPTAMCQDVVDTEEMLEALCCANTHVVCSSDVKTPRLISYDGSTYNVPNDPAQVLSWSYVVVALSLGPALLVRPVVWESTLAVQHGEHQRQADPTTNPLSRALALSHSLSLYTPTTSPGKRDFAT
jgi:hypothetical protein